MTPDEFRAQFIKSRGLNLTSTPVTPAPIPIPPPTPVQTVPITPTDPQQAPIRTNPDGTIAGNLTSNPTDNPAAWQAPPPFTPAVVPPDATAAAVPPAKPPAFPVGGTAPIVATNPVVEQAPGGGISLNSNPVAPGWAGTVGLPASPEEAKGFEKGVKNADLMAGLEQIAKGAKPKAAADSGANTITPMNLQPNQPSNLSANLMAQILQNRRRQYGISLAG